MERRASPTLSLLVFFLVFSYVLSSSAVSATRILKSFNNEKSVQDEVIDLSDSGSGVFEMEEGYPERRMDFESTDYPGTGANNHHDPKTPGRA